MLVTNSNIQFSSNRTAAQTHHDRVDIQVFPARTAPQRSPEPHSASASTAIRSATTAANSTEVSASEAGSEDAGLDPKLALLKSIIEAITGHLMELFDVNLNPDDDRTAATEVAASPAPARTEDNPPPEAGGMRVRTLHEYAEHEAMSFRAHGSIETADGKSIEFSIQLQMQRSFVERSQSEIIWGDVPEMKDPLVVNFDGRPVSLTADRYAFDINADGSLDQIPGLSSGRAYLILDRNNNGIVDDGSEVIGALSGNAFSDLKAMDDDGNGFVDAGDVSFSQLGLWRPGNTDNRYDSTSDHAVAALATDSLATEFKLTTSENEQLGQLQRSSIYVTDSGQVKTTQQVDLVS